MLSRFLDLLYPSVCELCQTSLDRGGAICLSCANLIPRVRSPFCEACGESFDGSINDHFQCQNCQGINHDFDFARASLKGLSTAFDLVHRLKYRRQFFLARDLARFLDETIQEDERFLDYSDALLVPVPLHWRRQQWRHGNQAVELARELAPLCGLELSPSLVRKRSTQTQTKLTRKQRLSNLRGAFGIRKRDLSRLQDRDVILIDDVFTTGATTHECSRILKRTAGVSKVAVLTLVRG